MLMLCTPTQLMSLWLLTRRCLLEQTGWDQIREKREWQIRNILFFINVLHFFFTRFQLLASCTSDRDGLAVALQNFCATAPWSHTGTNQATSLSFVLPQLKLLRTWLGCVYVFAYSIEMSIMKPSCSWASAPWHSYVCTVFVHSAWRWPSSYYASWSRLSILLETSIFWGGWASPGHV